jgi:hypothetical protein
MKRVQRLVEIMDILRLTLMQPLPKDNQVVVIIQWETFDGAMGCLVVPPPSSTSMNANWETFE